LVPSSGVFAVARRPGWSQKVLRSVQLTMEVLGAAWAGNIQTRSVAKCELPLVFGSFLLQARV
jgi:hypothetical protein